MVFYAGNLLDMGLRLELSEALKGMRNWRFVLHTIVWGFVVCPALAYLLTLIMPLDEPYAMGLILLGMAPSVSFLPKMVDRAHGDLSTTATFMLVASVFLIVYMPLMVPLVFKSMTVSPWTIAKPLVMFILAPMLLGMTKEESQGVEVVCDSKAVQSIAEEKRLLTTWSRRISKL